MVAAKKVVAVITFAGKDKGNISLTVHEDDDPLVLASLFVLQNKLPPSITERVGRKIARHKSDALAIQSEYVNATKPQTTEIQEESHKEATDVKTHPPESVNLWEGKDLPAMNATNRMTHSSAGFRSTPASPTRVHRPIAGETSRSSSLAMNARSQSCSRITCRTTPVTNQTLYDRLYNHASTSAALHERTRCKVQTERFQNMIRSPYQSYLWEKKSVDRSSRRTRSEGSGGCSVFDRLHDHSKVRQRRLDNLRNDVLELRDRQIKDSSFIQSPVGQSLSRAHETTYSVYSDQDRLYWIGKDWMIRRDKKHAELREAQEKMREEVRLEED